MTLRTTLITLGSALAFVACGAPDATEHEIADEQSDAILAPAQVCQQVFDAALSQPNVAPLLNLTWISRDRSVIVQDILSLPSSSRVIGNGDISKGMSRFGDLDGTYALVFRKRSQLLPGGAKLALSSVLDFQLDDARGRSITSFSVVPTECSGSVGLVTITAVGPDDSRLTATITPFFLGG